MKLTTLLLFVNFIHISAIVYSQNERFTFKADKIQIRELLDKIELQSKYKFLYRSEYLNSTFINVDAQNLSMDELLSTTLNKTGITYKILEDNLIVIVPKEFATSFQQKKLTGKVTDANSGEPLPGVSISIEGTSTGTITNIDGSYSLDISGQSPVLVFSFVGYLPEKVQVANQNVIDVKLIQDIKTLEEVVVVGYGSQKRGDVTGAITSVRPDDLNKGAANLNIGQMLEGRVAGLYINQYSGNPGSDPLILVRGNGTTNVATTTRPDGNNPNPLYNPLIGNSADPLVIVDGFPLAHSREMNTISPNDIESISVLKDASSTAIYGARGANGVILITTKKGKSGKLNVNYQVQFAAKVLAKKIDLLNDKQYLSFYGELANDPGFKINNTSFNLTKLQADSILSQDGGGTDWQKEVATNSTTFNQSHSLSLSGGTGPLNYVISGDYLRQFAPTAPGKYDRYNGKVRLGYEKGKLGVDVSLAYTYENNDNNQYNYWNAVSTDPSQKVYNTDGSFTINRFPNNAWRENPLFGPSVTTSFWNQGSTYINANARYEILPGLLLRTNLGYSKYNYQTFSNTGAAWNSGHPDQTQNSAGLSYRNSGNSIAEVFADYTKKIGEKNTITALAGASIGSKQYNDVSASGSRFASPYIGYYAMQASTIINQPITSWFTSKSESAFGRINYNYDDRYLATFNFRADGATQFGPANKVGYFPSAAVAWRVSKEGFMKNLGFVENLKLRIGYGVAGNDNIPSGLTDLKYQYNVYAGQPILAKVGNYVPNPNLKWERVKTLNLGLDFALRNLQLQVDYYIKNSDDLLLQKNVPQESGYSQILVNQGKVQNKGIEATLGLQLTNLFGSKLSYAPQFNIAYNKSVVKDLGGDVVTGGDIWVGQTQYGSTMRKEAGQQLNSFWLYHSDGVWQKGEEGKAALYGAVPGDPKIRDVNGDSIIDSKDRYYAGGSDPSVILGLANRFIYKNFELNVFIQGVLGNKVYNQNKLVLDNPSINYLGNLSPSVLNRWTPDNPSNTEDSKLKPLSTLLSQSDKYLEDASFVRLREIVLSYRIPLKSAKIIKDIRFSLGVTNVFTITKYSGLNPDVRINDNQWNMSPYTRTFTLGVNANF